LLPENRDGKNQDGKTEAGKPGLDYQDGKTENNLSVFTLLFLVMTKLLVATG
jgi:hypothetical protein